MICWHADGYCPYRCFDSDSSFEFGCFCPTVESCPYQERKYKEEDNND